jgi:hypothetical protein
MFENKGEMQRKDESFLFSGLDLGSRVKTRNYLALFILFSLFIVISSISTYRAQRFTDTVEFCGKLCHNVMKPELTAFEKSAHTNVTCSECHIGLGAGWFVKTKLTGLYQVYSTLFDKYHRPIEAPVENLRPAEETCYTCHWPKKFFGAVLRTWTYYLSDEENSPWTIKMMLNIGGGDPAHGPIKGIHWHMKEANIVEYIASDDKRLVIPWIRAIDQDGNVTVYRTEDEEEALTEEQIATMPRRQMDCIDCHNRPTHQFRSPNEAMDLALFTGRIDGATEGIKYNAASLLAEDYETERQALEAVEKGLREAYAAHPALEQTVREVQEIYRNNFFPEMKVSWEEYPDHIGHKITPGCFRCHDGKHVSDSGKRIMKDCDACHTIIAQGPGLDLHGATSNGLEFVHPVDIDEEWKAARCDDCHTGSPLHHK